MSSQQQELASVDCIRDTDQLDEMLSRPTPQVIEAMGRLDGDLLILGVAGKTGPSLARMARRAADAAGVSCRVIGASRFTNPTIRAQLESWNVETITCDLLDHSQLAALPKVPNVIFSAARKFGSSGNEALTWAMNVYLPGMVAEAFRDSRIVAYSSGNIYPLVPVAGDGSKETDEVGPVGEYAMSVLGRERMFTHFSQVYGTQAALVRLYYANEMRYGTLRDVGEKVFSDQPVDITMGYVNAIWQGDSNAMTLRCFDHVSTPPLAINVAGTEKLSVRRVAERFGELFAVATRARSALADPVLQWNQRSPQSADQDDRNPRAAPAPRRRRAWDGPSRCVWTLRSIASAVQRPNVLTWKRPCVA